IDAHPRHCAHVVAGYAAIDSKHHLPTAALDDLPCLLEAALGTRQEALAAPPGIDRQHEHKLGFLAEWVPGTNPSPLLERDDTHALTRGPLAQVELVAHVDPVGRGDADAEQGVSSSCSAHSELPWTNGRSPARPPAARPHAPRR